MLPEYEVKWNGAHQGRDADLLCAERIRVKRSAPCIPSIGDQILHALKRQPDLTVRAVAQRLELNAWQVRRAIRALSHRGLIETVRQAPDDCCYYRLAVRALHATGQSPDLEP